MEFGSGTKVPPHTLTMTMLVRFSEPAMPVDRLLEALSKQTHIALVCAPEVRDEILLLHVRDLPLQDVMDRIAEVAGASWRQAGDTWFLERPAKIALAQQERDIQTRAAIIAQSLKRILAPLQKPWNEAALRAAIPRRQEPGKTEYLDPVYRAFLRCLSDVAPEAIARIPEDGRVVFATEPTRMQKPLGRGAQVALAKLTEEQRFFGTTLRKAGIGKKFEDDERFQDFRREHGAWRRRSPYLATPVRALLIIERKWTSSYEAQLILLDKNRRIVVGFRVPDGILTFDMPGKREVPSENSPLVPFSHQSHLLRSLEHMTIWGIPVESRPSPETMALLTMPEKYEPLSLAVSDGYLALARNKKRNLIAALPDYLSYYRFGPTLSTVWNESRMRIRERNHWLIITPLFPSEARLSRIDRATLGRMVRWVAQHGSYRVEDIAELAASGKEIPFYHFAFNYLAAVGKGDYISNGNNTLLALYGALTADQQKELLAGHPLPFRNLNERQLRFARLAVFGARYSRSERKTRTVPKEYTDLFSEPTEGYPNGLPDDGAIRATRKRERYVGFFGPGKTKEELYWWMNESPHGGYSGPTPRRPAGGFETLRYDVRYLESVTVEVDVTPWHCISSNYQGPLSPPTGPPVPLSKLPPDIQKRVKDELLWIRQLRGEVPMQ